MSRIATADGVGLHYQVEGPGEAPAVVLVNSLGADLGMWEPQAAAFADRWRVIRYDARGHGQSDAPDGPYTLDQLGQDLMALLDELEIARSHVCGLSLGGLTALWLAVHHPERVAGLVLANTAARIGSAEGWAARIEAVRAGGVQAVREIVLGRFLSAEFRAVHPEVERQVGAMLERTPAVGYMGACAALRDGDLRSEVVSIRVPALILAGGRDEATPPADSRALQAAIAGSELVVLAGAAHLSNLEQPEQFNRTVLAFLDRQAGDKPSRYTSN